MLNGLKWLVVGNIGGGEGALEGGCEAGPAGNVCITGNEEAAP